MSLCILVAAAVPAVALAGHATAPRHLIDGSTAPAVPAVLEGQGGAFVMTKVRVRPKAEMSRLLRTCPSGPLVARRSIVERIGVNGRDITFLAAPSEIEGCDRNPRARAIHRPWCGSSGWGFRNGRVSDARLDICSDGSGRAVVAFGWINAPPRAKWIVVDQPGFREVYPVAAGLPVRVSTVSEIGSPTTFRITQYDAHGVLLARRVVKASIAS